PDVLHGPLADVANRTGGIVVASRVGEVAARAPIIAAQLGHGVPIHDVALAGAEALSGLELPAVMPAGSGASAIAWYVGAPPSRLSPTGTRGEQPVRVATLKTAGSELGALALASVDPAAITPHAPEEEPASDEVEATRNRLNQARRTRGVVTDDTSLV